MEPQRDTILAKWGHSKQTPYVCGENERADLEVFAVGLRMIRKGGFFQKDDPEFEYEGMTAAGERARGLWRGRCRMRSMELLGR